MPAQVIADSAFLIGKAHHDTAKPCQDYALASSDGARAWAVVADGCSTGGRTDLGSRMWAHAAGQLLEAEGVELLNDVRTCAARVTAQAELLLAPFCYDDGHATLVLAATDGRQARVALFGDGVVAVKYRDGRLQQWDVRFGLNAPRYLNYERRPALLAQWEQACEKDLLQVNVSTYHEAGDLLALRALSVPATQDPGYLLCFDEVADIEALFVCTDGATSFEGRTLFQTLTELTAVRNPVGQYVQRRMGALARQWKRSGAPGPEDDLAVAALWFGESA